MEFNEKDMLLIENYLDGKLSGEQQEAFLKRLKNDEGFAETFEFRKKMPGLMKDASNYETTRNEVGMAIRQQKQLVFGVNRNLVFAAAALILVIIGFAAILRFAIDKDAGQSDQLVDKSLKEVLKIDEPLSFATSAIAPKKLEIISPTKFQVFQTGEKIVFKWNSQSRTSGKLSVENYKTKEVVFDVEVFLQDREYIFSSQKPDTGKYTWYLVDTIPKGSFTIEPYK